MNFLAEILPFLQFNFLAKVGFLAIDFFFTLFLLIAIKQAYAMNDIISGTGNFFAIKLWVGLLLGIAISLFLTALVIL